MPLTPVSGIAIYVNRSGVLCSNGCAIDYKYTTVNISRPLEPGSISLKDQRAGCFKVKLNAQGTITA